MPPQFEHIEADADHLYHVRPDEIERLVEELEALRSPNLRIDRFPQYGGRAVFALTITRDVASAAVAAGRAWRARRRLYVSRAHAHEPAGVAAQAEIAKALIGWRAYADRNREWRAWALDNLLVTLVPDSNPCGSQRAPVKFWDGAVMDNDRFKMWMFGESGERAGERFPRVPSWDMREVAPPRLLGVCYEQIDPHTYVEPNRDRRSTFFRAFFALDETFQYQFWLDLHQTEFINSDRNCMVNLPNGYRDLSAPIRDADLALAEAIQARWRREGGAPKDQPQAPYGGNPEQHGYLSAAWRDISERLPRLVTEVQNNNPRTPPRLQVHLQLTAILETMDWLAARR